MEVQNHRDSTRRHRRLNAIVGDATEPSDGSENPRLLKQYHIGIAKKIQ